MQHLLLMRKGISDPILDYLSSELIKVFGRIFQRNVSELFAGNYIYVYIFIYIYICVYVWLCIYVFMYGYVCFYMFLYICTCTYMCIPGLTCGIKFDVFLCF